ncbi:trypsin-like serine peptidase [Streptomyces reniochalinae]|uniref:V8-like Glu-specific endopeptidase n=1 Tax=Streptomyces reniochalinae TaxID=2250578 RepID=A0A367E5U1_9ACTN|nr:hypothetical protein [Streptomyces reniochalinae]RCG13424.1 hypothetical protein DQ392_33370 [Streptomyces reniochalinae]
MSRIRRTGTGRPVLAAAALAATLALTATACGSGDDSGKKTDAKPAASDSAQDADGSGGGKEKIGIPDKLPKDLPTSLKDLDSWRGGAWKNWDKDQWVRGAKDFINPYLKGHWDLGRMKKADDNEKKVPENIESTSGAADTAEPRPVKAEAVKTPYTRNAAPAGKIFMDTPEGPMVCSGTVVKDPRHPGKSNLVATAGHCVHSGRSGGWLRNITFIPAFNDRGLDMPSVNNAPPQEVAPYGEWWVKWAQTTNYWIQKGAKSGGGGSQQDFAVLSVQPVNKSGKSLEETVGNAVKANFDAPSPSRIRGVSNYGYPAAPPFDGAKMYSCTDKPGALTIDPSEPALYRIGCTMTGGSSGGAWLVKGAGGKPELISVNSIGPHPATWLAGPRLGKTAEAVFDAASQKG